MKRWEWFFETEHSHPRMIRVIASDLETARTLAADHLGTDKFHQITVQTFFEDGCEFHTIEESTTQSSPHELKAAEHEEFNVKAAFEAFQEKIKSGQPLPTVDPIQLKSIRTVGQRIAGEHRTRGGTGTIGIGVGIYEKECGVRASDMPAFMFRNALIEMLLSKGDFKEEGLNDSVFQIIARMPVDNSFTPELLFETVREQLRQL